MHIGDVGRCLRHARRDLLLLPFEVVHAGLHGGLVHAILNGGDDPRDGLLYLGKRLAIPLRLSAAIAVQPVHFLGIGAHGFGHRLR